MSVITHCDFCQTEAGSVDVSPPAMIVCGGSGLHRKNPRPGESRRYRRERARYDLCEACMRLALRTLRAAARSRKT